MIRMAAFVLHHIFERVVLKHSGHRMFYDFG